MNDFCGKTYDNTVIYNVPTPKQFEMKDKKDHKATRTTSLMKVAVNIMFTEMTAQ